MPGLVTSLENRLDRGLSSGPILGKANPSHVWWPGPQQWGKNRDNPELDHYGIWDRRDDHPFSRCTDSRFRSVATKDRSKTAKFGPSATDLDNQRDRAKGWCGQVTKSVPSWAADARPTHYHEEMNWKLDRYGLTKKLDHSFTTSDTSRSQSFHMIRSKTDRFAYPRLFSKDYSKTGCTLNRYQDVHVWKPPGKQSQRSASSPGLRPQPWRR